MADKQEDNHNLNSINNSNVGAEKPIVLRLQYGCIKEIRDIWIVSNKKLMLMVSQCNKCILINHHHKVGNKCKWVIQMEFNNKMGI